MFAVAGALAAVPQVRDLVAGSPAPAAHASADKLAYADDLGAEMGRTASRSLAHVSVKAAAGRHSASPPPVPTKSASPPGSATPAPSASPTDPPGPAGVHCSPSATGMLPDNYATIVTFLVAHGYSDNAAAGVAGNIYQESKGDPESAGDGGGGLIGWTPLPAGLVTGNPAADLQAQLEEILRFDEQWSQYLPALNDAGTPGAAADIYVTDFERAGVPAAGTREEAADAVARACGF